MKIRMLLTLALPLAVAATEVRADCDTVTLRGRIGETLRIGPPPSPKGHTHGICQWIVQRLDGAGCTLNRVTVAGTQVKPGTTISVTRASDGAVAASRSLQGGHGSWQWSGQNLNCSTLGCATSRYVIKTDDLVPNHVCMQPLSVTFLLL